MGGHESPVAATRPPAASADLMSAVARFHDLAVVWHLHPHRTPEDDGGIVTRTLQLHAVNFALWHHEDAVRRIGIGDREAAATKRCIDILNARRNATVEDIDMALLGQLRPRHDAPLHTETPAAIVDRLSVLTLRIMHALRAGQPPAQLTTLHEQYDDLIDGLERFLAALHSGDVRFKVYRQFKSAGQRSYCPLFEDQPG